jgi:hypothetical protein
MSRFVDVGSIQSPGGGTFVFETSRCTLLVPQSRNQAGHSAIMEDVDRETVAQ